MYKTEACYLSAYGHSLIEMLLAKGVKDYDLALEILHLLVPDHELYNLEVGDDEHREATG